MIYSTRIMSRTLALALALAGAGVAQAQSTVAELLEKGGKLLTKAEFLEMIPARVQQQWPNRQGEEDLVLSGDGKISGTGYHYSSRSDSPVTGQWTVEDDGKICAPKTFTAWRNSINLCWYVYKLGGDYFGAQKTEPEARVGKVKSMQKVAAQ